MLLFSVSWEEIGLITVIQLEANWMKGDSQVDEFFESSILFIQLFETHKTMLFKKFIYF